MGKLTILYWEVVLRLLLASLQCGAIGFERISLTGFRDYE